MNSQSCESMADRLVPYADRELCESDAQQVAAHLAECSRCHSELRLLQRSLELARAVWQEAAGDVAPLPTRIEPRRQRFPAVVGLATCAAVLLVAMVWLSLRDRSQPDVKQTARNGHTTEYPATENLDVTALIAREGRSARLAATVKLLTGQPGLEKFKDQAERYLVETYGGTVAVAPMVPAVDSSPTANKEPQS